MKKLSDEDVQRVNAANESVRQAVILKSDVCEVLRRNMELLSKYSTLSTDDSIVDGMKQIAKDIILISSEIKEISENYCIFDYPEDLVSDDDRVNVDDVDLNEAAQLVAKEYTHANAAVNLARLYMGEKAQDDQVGTLARVLMGIGAKKLKAAIDQFKTSKK